MIFFISELFIDCLLFPYYIEMAEKETGSPAETGNPVKK